MSTFHREDAEAICRIPLSRRNVSDSITWIYNTNGNFTVKLAYKVARKIQRGGDRAGISSGYVGKRFGLHYGSSDSQIKSKSSAGGHAMTSCSLASTCQEERLLVRKYVLYVPRNQNQPSTHYGSVL